jgi:predicted dehydrogenase
MMAPSIGDPSVLRGSWLTADHAVLRVIGPSRLSRPIEERGSLRVDPMSGVASIGTAVVGTGFIGTVHVEALRRIGVRVTGVLGSTPERGDISAERLGVPRAYASLDELLADPAVDVVHVTSPNDLHLGHARAALSAGKHIVCEKPLAMTSVESTELADLATTSGRVAAVNFNIRFYPLNQHASELIASGGVGDVRLVTGHYFQDWLLLESDWNWRLLPERGGALRAVGDIGSHWLDLVQFVTGLEVESVMADVATFVPTHRQPTGPVETFSTIAAAETVARNILTEDTANILLRFVGGARGGVSISQISPGRKNSLQYEIDGSDAALAWDAEAPDRLWLGHRERPNELMDQNPAFMGAAARSASVLPAGHVEGFADTFGAMFRAVYADVAAGRPSEHPAYATFADGHREMLIGEAIAESARSGRWVDIPRVPTAVVEATR